MHVNTTQSNVA